MATFDMGFIEDAARAECKNVTDEIVQLIKLPGHTPRDTGRLQDGYHSVRTADGAEVVQTQASYWADVEYGHRIVTKDGRTVGYVDPQSHVRAAVEEIRTRKGRA